MRGDRRDCTRERRDKMIVNRGDRERERQERQATGERVYRGCRGQGAEAVDQIRWATGETGGRGEAKDMEARKTVDTSEGGKGLRSKKARTREGRWQWTAAIEDRSPGDT